jgi:hypothetical protein
MKHKPVLGPRNPLVAPSLFRKAGTHDKPFKAQRRADKVAFLQDAGRAVRHRTFNPEYDGFDSLAAYQENSKRIGIRAAAGRPGCPSVCCFLSSIINNNSPVAHRW